MNLTTTYMGLKLKNPIVPSASPLSENIDNIYQMQEVGASAVVLHSLFEEQIEWETDRLEHYLDFGAESHAEAVSYFPDLEAYKTGPDEYLELIGRAKSLVDIPIIGSLNGVSAGGWIKYAQKIEQAGADALELNVYYIPTNIKMTGAEVEQIYVDAVKSVTEIVSIPVSVKLNPFFSSIPHITSQLADAGAGALVLFNRFYQPDFNLEKLEATPNLLLSDSNALRLPLRWIAILYGQTPVDFAITSGVHTHQDALKGLMAGAKVTMMTSELLQNGIERIGVILERLRNWMEENEYESLAQMQGSMSQQNVAQPAAFERANYMKVLRSWS